MADNQQGNDNQGGDDAPDPKLVGLINSTVHKILTERDARLEKKLVATMTNTIGSKFDEIRQLLVDGDQGQGDQGQQGQGDQRQGQQRQQPTPGQHQMSPEDRAALKKAQADAQDAKKQMDEWKSRAEKERQTNLRAEEKQLLLTLLQGKVKPAMLDMVVDQLHAKHLSRDEETNNILWKDADGTFVPAKDGIAGWVKSDTGKEFAPARDVRGAGGRGGEDIPTKPGSMTLEGLGDIVNQAMARGR